MHLTRVKNAIQYLTQNKSYFNTKSMQDIEDRAVAGSNINISKIKIE
jgi:hypothetical protein